LNERVDSLPELLDASASQFPDRVAVVHPDAGSISYNHLLELAESVANRLRALGVEPGDRVGIYLDKSIDAVAAIFGAMKAGAAYVPVDPSAPAWRSAYIFDDCRVAAVVLESRLRAEVESELATLDAAPAFLEIAAVGDGSGLREAVAGAESEKRGSENTRGAGRDDLAYILYTSGSTGRPKGVMLTHGNALSFVNWCSETFQPTEQDRFSAHAPFHFDLSILDLFVSLKHGAALVLIPSDRGREPVGLAQLISDQQLTMWYSAPSILSMLAQYGRLEEHDYTTLRMVLFAGEVFPVKHLRTLHSLVPGPRYFNLYGPTETNVCTFYEIPREIPEDRTVPYPIGKVCSHLAGKVVDEDGREVRIGAEGELCISGPGVTQGYWNLPDRTATAYLGDDSDVQWYRTGDIVLEQPDGNYLFVGRRDRMVKRRGHRIELGEIEAGLYRHPAIEEAAVVAVPDEHAGVRIKAFLSSRDGSPLSVLELKRFCAQVLPMSMVPDQFLQQEALPKTSTDKIDYQRLGETT
jgi:amino acid adenylation domain-containing protein